MENKFILFTGYDTKKKMGIRVDNIISFWRHSEYEYTVILAHELCYRENERRTVRYKAIETPDEIYNKINNSNKTQNSLY